MTTTPTEQQPASAYQVARQALADVIVPAAVELGPSYLARDDDGEQTNVSVRQLGREVAEAVLESGVVIPAQPGGQQVVIVIPEGLDPQKVADWLRDHLAQEIRRGVAG